MKRFLLIAPLLLLFSCTVQKRHYNKGFFVSWKKSAPKQSRSTEQVVSKALPVNTPEKSKALTPEKKAVPHVTSADTLLAEIHPENGGPGDSCDVLLYKNGSESRVKITEVNETQVKYKRCDMPDGPQYICNKTDLFKISYVNGTFEVIRVKEKEPEQVVKPNDPYNQWLQERDRPKYRRKNTKLATSSLVFGILGFYPLAFIGGIIALITGLIQLNKISTNPEQYGAEKKALVGIGLGIASILLWTLFIALIVLAI